VAESIERLERTWNALGREDPLWGVLSHSDKRGGRWELTEFLETGERDIRRLHMVMMQKAGAPERFERVLDFGCGVGRLSLAWSGRAARVTGADISEGMIEAGRRIIGQRLNVELVLNVASDLGCWPNDTFDLVFSYICLQHMPWPIAAGYLAEFARVCRPGQWVAFQLPARQLGTVWGARLRQRIVDLLPFGLGAAYRRWRHGSRAVFDMFFTPPAVLEEAAAGVGLRLMHKEPDPGGGPGTEGFFYVFRKR
jgi:SAM-dependent methyltransferase